MRHNSNHRDKLPNCKACEIEADFDRARKIERKLFRRSNPRQEHRKNRAAKQLSGTPAGTI